MKKTVFVRKDANKKARLEKKWHAPKGIHNKTRLSRKSRQPKVRPGYKSDSSLKNTHRKTGLQIVRVSSKESLEAINPSKQAIIIEGLGRKKKAEIVKIAAEKKITVLGLTPGEYLEETKKFVEEKLKASKDKKKKKAEKEKKAKEDKKKEEKKEEAKQPEKETSPEEKSEEDKKKEEKAEKDKLLTKRQ